jgi:hypothetical protein
MFSPSTTIKFPKTGKYATETYLNYPQMTGLIQITEIRNLLESDWADYAINQAINLKNLKSNAIDLRIPITIDQSTTFNFENFYKIITKKQEFLTKINSNIELTLLYQSSLIGFIKSIYYLNNAILTLFKKIITETSTTRIQRYYRLALQVSELINFSTILFIDLYKSINLGLIAFNSIDLGMFFSGEYQYIVDRTNQATSSEIKTASISPEHRKLYENLLLEEIFIFIPPSNPISELLKFFQPILTNIAINYRNFEIELIELDKKFTSETLTVIEGLLQEIQITTPITNFQNVTKNLSDNICLSKNRSQGVRIIDGTININGENLSNILKSQILSIDLTKKEDIKTGYSTDYESTNIQIMKLLSTKPPIINSSLVDKAAILKTSSDDIFNSFLTSASEIYASNLALSSLLSNSSQLKEDSINQIIHLLENNSILYNEIYIESFKTIIYNRELLTKSRKLLSLLKFI